MQGPRKKLYYQILGILRTKNPDGISKYDPQRAEILRRIGERYQEKEREAYISGKAAKWNLLGELNRLIAAGKEEYIPLRNVILAEIEGYLKGDALSYSLSEALKELSQAEISALQRHLKERAEITPEERKALKERIQYEPEVIRAKKRLEKAESYQRKLKEIAKKAAEREKKVGIFEFRYGDLALARKEADEAAKKDPAATWFEIHREIPRNEELWNQTVLALAKKYEKQEYKKRRDKIYSIIRYYIRPKKLELSESALKKCKDIEKTPYVPPKLSSSQKRENTRIKVLINDDYAEKHLDIVKKEFKAKHGYLPSFKDIKEYRAFLIPRMCNMIKVRWRNHVMEEYEKRGGDYLKPTERKIREAAIKKELDSPYPLAGGFYGIISESNGKFEWKVFDPDARPLMSAIASTKGAASRDLNIANRIMINLIKLDEPGFDNLPEQDRRWIIENKPKLSLPLRRILLAVAGEKRKISPETARYLVSEEAFEEVMPRKKEENCEGMTLGEEREISGDGYTLIVKRMRKKYTVRAITDDNRESREYRFAKCEDAISRGHVIAGAMMGAEKVAKAVSNPGKMKRLQNEAEKYLEKFARKNSKKKRGRKRNPNPRIPREPAAPGTIGSLSAMLTIPYDSDEAYRLGYYSGIITGIDTCGIQHWAKRRRIRKEFEQRLLDAVLEQRRKVVGGVEGKKAETLGLGLFD
jgi:hypothetical protein